MNIESLIAYEAARCQAYKMLSECYLLPDERTPEKFIALSGVLKTISPEAAQYASDLKPGLMHRADPEQLKVDFTKLFVGPFSMQAAPYASVYLERERRIMGDSTLDVQYFYRQSGLELARGFIDPPDHIAVELEFMHFLICKEMAAIEVSDSNRKIYSLRMQKEFFDVHLRVWVFQFFAAVESNAAPGFYQNLSKAADVFLKEDYQAICTALACMDDSFEN